MEVVLTPEAAADLDALAEPMHARVLRVLERLARWPEVSGAKALRAGLAGHYRMRSGDWRVQFRVEGRRVIVEKIGHRDRFYEQ